jgi:methyl-accepting chemotaxis protein
MDSRSIAIFGVALVWMLYLAIKDERSLKNGDHTDYKSVIVSIGVLGTFIGIVLGLWEFNTNDIDSSVPKLLEGLKFAFITSIAGMSISVLLSSVQRRDIASGNDELSVLKEIHKETNLLRSSMSQEIRDLRAEVAKGSVSITDVLKNQVTKDDLILFREEINKDQKTFWELLTTNFSKVNSEISAFSSAYQEGSAQLRQELKGEFGKTNESLEKAIDVLARGATEEIIRALKTVIADFNNNLIEQFGDNFKELNAAINNLVVWQSQFKDIVERDHGLLIEVRGSLQDSSNSMKEVAGRNAEVLQVYSQLKDIIDTFKHQLDSVNAQLKEYSDMGAAASKAFESLSNGFESVQSGIGAQSEAIAQLTNEISSKVPESLGKLEDTLVALTTQFGEDYKAFLDRYKALVQ